MEGKVVNCWRSLSRRPYLQCPPMNRDAHLKVAFRIGSKKFTLYLCSLSPLFSERNRYIRSNAATSLSFLNVPLLVRHGHFVFDDGRRGPTAPFGLRISATVMNNVVLKRRASVGSCVVRACFNQSHQPKD